jgi:hypothetical protein
MIALILSSIDVDKKQHIGFLGVKGGFFTLKLWPNAFKNRYRRACHIHAVVLC